MIRHYLKIAWRNLSRHKVLTFINISGLSIGIACFSLFLLYTVNEFSFDRFNAKASRIYRVYDWWSFPDHEGSEPSSSTPLGPALKQDLADVEDFVRIKHEGEKLVRVENRIQRISLSFADPQLFSIFTFPLIEGNANAALATEKSIVLTRDKAMQLFGKTDVVGRIIEIRTGDQFEPFEIGAVAENIPANSSVHFDILGNFGDVLNSEIGRASLNNWNMTIGINVYVLLRANSALTNDPGLLTAFRQKYFPNETSAGSPTNGYGLQPLTDVHTGVKIDRWGASDQKNSWILISIAFGILLIACINFVTLSIGRSAKRATEVGIRKITGSGKNQLIYQFLTESLFLSAISAVLGLALAHLLLPFFNELSGKTLTFSISQYPELPGILLSTIFMVGLFSGIYPALVISGFQPVDVLKKNLRFSGSNFFTRSLVSFQFVLSIGLIISMIVILKQLSFMRSKDLGLDKENVIVINTQGLDIHKNYPVLKQTLTSESSISGVSASQIGLGEGEGQMGRRYAFGEKEETVIEYPVDSEFLNVMGIHLLAGRNFNPEMTSDTKNSVIVNEAMVKSTLGVSPEEALGKEFKNKEGNDLKTIIGVVKDINFEDLTRTVRAQMFLTPQELKPNVIFVRITPGDASKAIATITKAWKNIVPDLPVRYNFLDQKFDDFYKKEKRWSDIITWAGCICIFLASLGLVGLTSLSVVNRTTEIGIRKVNGARISEVLVMLNKDFVKWVAIAFVIATPLAWYAMHKWLENFAYKTALSWWIFAIAGLLALGIALLTVSWQSWLAAKRNPVEALRYE